MRLVKTIGDAALLVGPDATTLLELALELIDAADAEGEDFPQLRVGMAAGAALSRAGDWYGRPVNLASRVTAIARPGSVLATREVRDAVRRRLPLVVGRSPLAEGRRRAGAPLPRAAPGPRRGRRSGRVGRRYAWVVATGGPAGTASGSGAAGRRSRRTDGWASHASAPARPTALIPISVACRPSHSAIGPLIAMPSGMRPSDTLKS